MILSHQTILGDCYSPPSGPPGATGPTGYTGPQGPAGEGTIVDPVYLSAYKFIDPMVPSFQVLPVGATASIQFDTLAVPPVGITPLFPSQFKVLSDGIYLVGWNLTFGAGSVESGPVVPSLIIDVFVAGLSPSPVNSSGIDYVQRVITVTGQALFILSANDIVELQVYPHGETEVQLITYLNSIFILKIADAPPP